MTAVPAEQARAPIWLRAIETVIAAAVYFALARVSLEFASLNANATPIWPATGLAIALLLVRGYALAPAVFIGAFAVNYAVTPSLFAAGAIAVGNGCEALFAAILINAWADGQRVFQSPVGIGKFAVVVTAAAAPVSASIGVATLCATGFETWNEFIPAWLTWWLGNVAGAILVTPALVLWARTIRGDTDQPFRTSALLAFAGALLIAIFAFTPLSPAPQDSRSALAFLVILPLVWSALRLGLRETATMALLISALAVWGVMAGSSPFNQSTLNGSLLLLVTFIVSATLPSLALAAERRQSQALLDQTRQELVQAQKLEALGTLTSGVAHDFNNLLASIAGGLRMLDRQDEERKRTTEALNKALERGSGLTRQLLAFARREPLKLERVATAEALESASSIITSSLRDDIHFELQLTPGLWPVKADRNQLEVALLNLAVNARDAMPNGGELIIHAENAAGADQERQVAISVIDSGEGMSEDVLARAFEPFFSTKAAGGGTGLGLAQVYGFATQCGGAVNVDSIVGRGTTVTITLPRA